MVYSPFLLPEQNTKWYLAETGAERSLLKIVKDTNNHELKNAIKLRIALTATTIIIDRFRYIKIQPKTIDLSTRLWGITTGFVRFIPQSLVLTSIVFG